MYDWIKYCVYGTHITADQGQHITELYQDAVKPADDHIFNLRREIIYQDALLVQLVINGKFLRDTGNTEIIELLKEDPFFINLPFNNIPADVDRMMAIHKSKLVKLKVKIAEYERHFENLPEQKPATEADWYSQLRVLSKWQGYQLKAKELSVSEYIVYLNDFKADIKRQENEHQARNSGKVA